MATTNPELRKALLKKLGVTPRRLNQKAAARKKKWMITPSQAVYTIAYEEGIDLSEFLSAEEMAEVRSIISQFGSASALSLTPQAKAKSERAQAKPAVVTIRGTDVERLPGMTATQAKDAKTMANVYPLLYIFEQSARGVITRVLRAPLGEQWWDASAVPRAVREQADKRKAGEDKDPWHGKRGTAMIDYTLLADLPKIVSSNDGWTHFKPLFDRKSWFEELVNDMNVSRRVVAHMNPLADDDVDHVKIAFRKWALTLKAKKDLIP